jgi:hypothetical protein
MVEEGYVLDETMGFVTFTRIPTCIQKNLGCRRRRNG